MKKNNYGKWSNPNITDEEWERMLEEQDFEYPTSYASLIDYIKNIPDKELDAIMMKIEELEEENEKERKKQLKLMKSFLQELGVKRLKNSFTIDEIKQKWKANFCKGISLEEQKECHMDEFLWHVFSYKKVSPVLWGKLAKKKFDYIQKRDMFVFTEHGKEMYRVSAPDEFKCYMLRLIYSQDVYFVDSKFGWTFILPHDYEPIWYSKDE